VATGSDQSTRRFRPERKKLNKNPRRFVFYIRRVFTEDFSILNISHFFFLFHLLLFIFFVLKIEN